MQKTILTIAGSALIALSTVQFASAASERQQVRTHHRAAATAQYRNSNAYAPPAYVAAPESYGNGYYSGGYSAPAGH
jgi:opacity protein-like surface antigen